MSTPVRLAIVGAGGIAQTHALAAARLPEVELVAVVDLDRGAAAALAEPTAAHVLTDVGALPDLVDLAVVATPPASHPEVVGALLEAGVAVLCEKPLALTSDQARAMADTAARTGTMLTMASKYRFATDIVAARSHVASGSIGPVVRLENAFAARVDMARRWNSDPAVSGGGVIMDNGTHSLDICRFLLGPLAEVLAVAGPRVQEVVVEDVAVLLVRAASGVLATIELSWSTDRATDRYLAVVGERGTIEVGWRGARVVTSSNPTPLAFGAGWDKVQALGGNLANVARALRGQEQLVVTIDDALASVAAVEAAHASLVHGGWQRIDAP